ncbi:hypothetical protein ACP4OV_030946 [Aristida adscensionis]
MVFVRQLSRTASSVAQSGPTCSLSQILLSCLAGDRLRRLLPTAHARAVVSGGLGDLLLANLLLRGYSKLGLLHDTRRLFDGMLRRNLVSWSSAISMYAQHGGDDEALVLFAAFRKSSDEVPNEFLLAGVLRACTQSRAVPFGEQVQGIATKLGLNVNVYVGTALINLYAKAGCMDAAIRVFDALPAKNPVTWTAVITGYSQIGQGTVALELYQNMGVEGVQPDRGPGKYMVTHIELGSILVPVEMACQDTSASSQAIIPITPSDFGTLAIVPLCNSKRSDTGQRQIRRPFSVPEVEALVEAVEKLGTGRWRDVKMHAFDKADHRTYVDLKDKWKTLVHTASISPQQRRGEPVPQELLDRVLAAQAYWSQQQAKLQDKPHGKARLPEICLA